MSLTSQPFELYNNFYDLLYHDKNYLDEAAYISNIIKKHDPNANNLLELGCGTGNFSEQLCKSGYKVTGIELNGSMVNVATGKDIEGFKPLVGDITSFDLAEKFDAAVSLFHVIGYLSENAAVLACFENVNKHLLPGGLFIFDVWYTPAVYSQQPSNRIKRVSNGVLDIRRIAEPSMQFERNIVQVNYEMIINNKETNNVQILKEKHLMRHFSTPEILAFANQSGFSVLRSEEFLSAKQPSADTWGVCYTLQKND